MRRRILTAMVGVVMLSTVVLTLPLGIVLARRTQADAIVELERASERTAARLEPDLASSGVHIDLADEEQALSVAVYAADGRKLAGVGPATADAVTSGDGLVTTDGIVGPDRVLARPVVFDGKRIATVRVAEARSEVADRMRSDIALLIAFDLVAVAVAGTVGAVVSSRLSRPMRQIRDDAVRLGAGDFAIGERASGVAEIDQTSHALADTASRLEAVLERERTFSADASHQLRTPVTSMRLAVESELEQPRADREAVLHDVLADLDRLESTIGTLLAVARDLPRDYAPVPLGTIDALLRRRWATRIERQGRQLVTHVADRLPVRVSSDIVDEVLDVLVDNARRHGRGTISVDIGGGEPGHLVVRVRDEGSIPPSLDVFRRRQQRAGHGIGLALARSLAEAEGGRLLIESASPTGFRLLLPDRGAPVAR